jgi:hypothetical protein
MAQQYIYIKLKKEWGGFSVGDVVRFGYTKGIGRIAAGEGYEVPKQRAVNDPPPVRAPVVETMTAEPSDHEQVEQATATPRSRRRRGRPRRVETEPTE